MKPFIFSLLLASILCFEGVIIPQPDILTNETAKCFVDADVSFLLGRAYFEIGKVDHNFVNNSWIALEAGIKRVYPFVYPSLYVSPTDQVKAVVDLLRGTNFEYIFIDIDIRSWREPKNMNVETMRELINGYTRAGYKVGIIATRYMWEQAFGNWHLEGRYSLIYESLDGRRDFKHFKPFGGFKHPVGKHYTNKNLCGVIAQMVYMPHLIA